MRKIYSITLIFLLLAFAGKGQLTAFYTFQDSAGCCPLVVRAVAHESSPYAVIERNWVISTCDENPVYITSTGSDSAFSYSMGCNYGCHCYVLQLTSVNSNHDTASYTGGYITIFEAPQFTNPTVTPTIRCSGTGSYLTVSPHIILSCGIVDTLLVNWGDGSTTGLGHSVDTVGHYVSANQANGCFNISLMAASNLGCVNQLTLDSSVCFIPAPQAAGSASVDSISCPNSNNGIIFSDNTIWGSDTTQRIWRWNFGDGTISPLQTPDYAYSFPGKYGVTLAICDGGCCDTAFIDSIWVGGPTITATYTPTSVCACVDTVQFSIASVQAVSLAFIYGCNLGSRNILVSPVGTIDNPTISTFSVPYCLIDSCQAFAIPDDANNCNVIYNLPYIYSDTPTVSFAYSVQGICDSGTVCFTDQTHFTFGVIHNVAWLWDFGDGTTDTVQNPCHFYHNIGTYIVHLRIVSSNGCTDSAKSTLIMFQHATADFTYAFTDTCNAGVVCFIDLSTAPFNNPITIWNWTFGDGQISNQETACHDYQDSGSYHVTLIVKANGCPDTIAMPVAVGPHFSVNFGYSRTDTCNTGTICFHDSTETNSGSTISSWLWNFHDGTTSAAENPCHYFTLLAADNVSLVVTLSNGCMDSLSKSFVVVLEYLQASFSYSVNGDSVTFTNNSVGNFNTVNWVFGDGTNSGNSNPTHSYQNFGTYQVTLTVADTDGCSSDTTLTIPVGLGSVPSINSEMQVSVFPNPFADYTTIEVTGEKLPCVLLLYDITGRYVGKFEENNQAFRLERKSMAPGVYLYQILQDGAVAAQGKIIAE